MLTRAFLLFLAMVTGLSAAQAADGARVCQGAEVAATLAAFADTVDATTEALGQPGHVQFAGTLSSAVAVHIWHRAATPDDAALATRLSDRART